MAAFQILIVLFFLLVFITLIGHGIWVLFGKLFGDAEELRRTSTGHNCPRCYSVLANDNDCAVCNWPRITIPRRPSIATKQAIVRQAARWLELGVIDVDAFERIKVNVVEQLTPEAPITSPQASAGGEIVFLDEPSEIIEAREATTKPLPPSAAIPKPLVARELPTPIVAPAPASPVSAQVDSLATSSTRLDRIPEQGDTTLTRFAYSFMEERNIRWGELVGGLLIVCCSIALVISFWSHIAQRPFLKFFVFNGVTAVLFGVGFYTERRWNLATTSRGLLIIATLLVPLNFLAIAAMSTESATTSLLTLTGEMGSFVVFAALVYAAGTIITPGCNHWLTVGVMCAALLELLMRRFVGPDSTIWLLNLIGAAPIVTYLVSSFGMSNAWNRIWNDGEPVCEDDLNGIFACLGIVSFATLLPLGLLCFKFGDVYGALHHIALLIGCFGLPALFVGTWLWQRVTARELSVHRTVATAIGGGGAVILLTALFFAWPHAVIWMTVAIAAGLALTLLGFRFRFPAEHPIGLFCLACGVVVLSQLALGNLKWSSDSSHELLQALNSATASIALIPTCLALIAAGWMLRHAGRKEDASAYAASTLAISVFSLALTTLHGSPLQISWVYLIFAFAALNIGILLHSPIATWVASLLLLISGLQGIANQGVLSLPYYPWSMAFLFHATVALLAAWILQRYGIAQRCKTALWQSAVVSLGGVLVPLVLEPYFTALSLSALLIWVGLLWLCLARVSARSEFALLFQISAAVSVIFLAVTTIESQPWYLASVQPWLEPRLLQVLGIALALYGIAWSAIRIFLPALNPSGLDPEAGELAESTSHPSALNQFRQFLSTPWSHADHAIITGCLLLVVGLVAVASVPGIMQELAPRAGGLAAAEIAVAELPRTVVPIDQLELLGMSRTDARDWGTGGLIVAVFASLAFGMWVRFSRWRLFGLIVLAWSICPLLATHFESGVAVATALRWLLALGVLVLSALVWFRHPFAQLPNRLGWPGAASYEGLHRDVRMLLLALTAVPFAVMGGGTALAAVMKADVTAELGGVFFGCFVCLAICCLLIGIVHTQRGRGDNLIQLPPNWRLATHVMWFVGLGPIVVVVMYAIAVALRDFPITGVDPQSWFGQIGTAASYSIPVFVLAITLVGYAIRDRSSIFAFSAGLFLQGASTAAFLVTVTKAGRPLDETWLQVAQINCVIAAAFALIWTTCWRYGRSDRNSLPRLLATQHAFSAVLLVATLLPATVILVVWPDQVRLAGEAGSLLGWIAILLTMAAIHWLKRQSVGLTLQSKWLGSWSLLALSLLISLSLCRWDTGNWLAYHFLLISLAVCAGYRVLFAFFERTIVLRRQDLVWTTTVAVTSFVLAFRALQGHPEQCWWTVGVVGYLALLCIAVTTLTRHRMVLYCSALLSSVATVTWWNYEGMYLLSDAQGPLAFIELLNIVNLSLSLPCILWLLIDKLVIGDRGENSRWKIAVHRVAATCGLVLLALVTATSVDPQNQLNTWSDSGGLTSLACIATVLAVSACLWDKSAVGAVTGMVLLGQTLVLMGLDWFGFAGRELLWNATIAVAGYALFAAAIWKTRQSVMASLRPLRVQITTAQLAQAHSILIGLTCLVSLFVLVSAFWIQFHFSELPSRLVAAIMIAATALALGLLAQGEKPMWLRSSSLTLGVLASVAIAWSCLPLDVVAPLLHRGVLATVGLVACLIIYGGLVKLTPGTGHWPRAVQEVVPMVIVGILASIVFVMSAEFYLFANEQPIPIHWLALTAQAMAIGLVAVAAIVAALVPGRDPLQLPDNQRGLYVYAAEIALALLFFHFRITMPWLFADWFTPYWPLVVMGIGFAGVALSELFRQTRNNVLSEPLQNTGVVLPVLPLLGFWAIPSVEIHYSLLLLSAGVLYALTSLLRKSFAFAMLSVVATNASLWFLLSDMEGYEFLRHPQLWLIPPALCALLASYINAKNLSEEQFIGIRYLSALVIYSSSTGDVFINGVGQAPWLPVVLGGLCVCGVLAGIWMRVRGFLYFGVAFLLVDLVTIIWYAAVDLEQTWVWSVSGIITGILIIALFAFFELKRDRVQRVVEQLRHWQA